MYNGYICTEYGVHPSRRLYINLKGVSLCCSYLTFGMILRLVLYYYKLAGTGCFPLTTSAEM
jgi:hypothetical protein